jgi:hypothetical protein
MSKWDDCVHCEETADLVVWEEWEEYKRQANCEGVSLPKNEDGSCGSSQRHDDLTDLPF